MNNSYFVPSYVFLNKPSYSPRNSFYPTGVERRELIKEEDHHSRNKNKYEDFVSKLLDENKKLLELVDFQKNEITNLRNNSKDLNIDSLKNSNYYPKNAYPFDEAENSNNSKISKDFEQKYKSLYYQTLEKNNMLLLEKEKLEDINNSNLNRIEELASQNEKLYNLINDLKETNEDKYKNEQGGSKKFGKIMDLITEMGEKEKNQEDLIFKILDLENKVNQLLMENEKLHNFIQTIKN